MNFLWKVGGEAGYGIVTTGLTFSKIATRSGYHAFGYVEYPSLIRGGHNTFEVQVSDDPVLSTKKTIDLLVCLNKDSYELHKGRLAPTSIVAYDATEFDFKDNVVKIELPFGQFLQDKTKAPKMMGNTIALGASIALMGGDIKVLDDILAKEFERKGEKVVVYNQELAHMGYDHIVAHHKDKCQSILVKKDTTPARVVITANDAFSLAATIADCRLYAAYPMSPSSTVFSTLAAWERTTGMIVRHPEDEIAAINNALGASAMGVRAAVGTSGGGFALMVESVSLAGIAELPVVIFVAQRPGPATGLPTWTEAADLLFAVFSGHGEFPKIVLAPGDAQEMLEISAEAFNLADIYQTPVIVLSDKFISESNYSVDRELVDTFSRTFVVDRGKTVANAGAKYLRYANSEDGISSRLIPGQRGIYYQSNSYEHEEDSHNTEDPDTRRMQVDKRSRKAATYLAKHFALPKIYGDFDKSDIVFVAWGGTKGPIIDAQKILKNEHKIETSFIHFTYLYPLDSKKISSLFDAKKRYIVVENNSEGQFAKLLRMQTGINMEEKLLKYDGRPIFPGDVVGYITKS